MSYSQAGQDLWALRCTNWATNGYYVDLGAHDGLQHSNSALLDLEYGWQGLCVEANVLVAQVCAYNRPNATVVNAAVAGYEGVVRFHDQWITSDGSGVEVRCAPLKTILDENNARKTIDYMSIDIEGMEYDMLAAFDFDAYRVHLMTVEHNLYADGPAEKDRIFDLLSSKGFIRCVEDAICLDPVYYGSKYEDWYYNASFYPGVGYDTQL